MDAFTQQALNPFITNKDELLDVSSDSIDSLESLEESQRDDSFYHQLTDLYLEAISVKYRWYELRSNLIDTYEPFLFVLPYNMTPEPFDLGAIAATWEVWIEIRKILRCICAGIDDIQNMIIDIEECKSADAA